MHVDHDMVGLSTDYLTGRPQYVRYRAACRRWWRLESNIGAPRNSRRILIETSQSNRAQAPRFAVAYNPARMLSGAEKARPSSLSRPRRPDRVPDKIIPLPLAERNPRCKS
ncbi:hypothetical protein SKAU_G00289170 [Synaphobranchus kaupii]|uniref:Uncharacterized protein n=1 Tax=Synaphobranchus kaupii TaxID=118154 RepID=A0A9Q1ETC2_SYNKA|nr:hypothetical protein SKAU_G00289170 [Synaphobranchus kaupii]